MFLSHFSAGVGRTGAYIMIDAMLEQAKHHQSLDIFNYLQTIREDRPFMVQTEVSGRSFANASYQQFKKKVGFYRSFNDFFL